MVRGIFVFLAVGFLLVSGYGCGIKARGYVAERERVDQANTGNAGYMAGQSGSSMAGRPTRKVYVLEFEREKKDKKKSAPKPAAATAAGLQPVVDEAATNTNGIETPKPETPVVEASQQDVLTTADGQKVTQYTVEKDDTLQKVSKKVYGSYGKWTKIYEANKDKIKNPNFVKPGTVLTIPQD